NKTPYRPICSISAQATFTHSLPLRLSRSFLAAGRTLSFLQTILSTVKRRGESAAHLYKELGRNSETMFFLSLAEHKLRLPPHLLALPLHEAIKKVLDDVFLDKVISDLGLCVSIYDIKDISGGFIQAGEGASTYTALFRMVVFRPFSGEVIIAKLKESDVDGLRLSVGFFDDIFVPAHQLPQPCHHIPDPERSFPSSCQTGFCACLTFGGSYWQIKFQVLNVSFATLPIEPQEKSFAPMIVTVSQPWSGRYAELLLFILKSLAL
ncbi:DNA-directed RNA polymerase III subunit rpc8, partial [Linum grandiflorum]